MLLHVNLAVGDNIHQPQTIIEKIFFVESGLISLLAVATGSEAIEIALVGREGMSEQVLGAGDTSPLKSFIQLAGAAWVIEAADYIAWIADRPQAMLLMAKYQKSLTYQIASTALAHGSFSIEERLARWLLMSFDRQDGDTLPLVHEFLALMLAVRRAGVTTAIHVLEGHQAIKATRGHIQLRNREKLIELSGGSYGTPEAEYIRLMGPKLN